MYRAHLAGNTAEAEIQQKQLSALHQMFHHPLVSSSFSYFTYSLKRILQHRGWLEHTDGLMPGFTPAAEFDKFILDHVRNLKL